MLLPPPPAAHAPRTARQSNTVADGYSRTDQRVLIATCTTPVVPPLNFDYNDGVTSDPVDFDDDDANYGATSVNHGDDDADDDTSTQPLRADETGVTVGRSPSSKTAENYTRRTRRLRTSQQWRWRRGDR